MPCVRVEPLGIVVPLRSHGSDGDPLPHSHTSMCTPITAIVAILSPSLQGFCLLDGATTGRPLDSDGAKHDAGAEDCRVLRAPGHQRTRTFLNPYACAHMHVHLCMCTYACAHVHRVFRPFPPHSRFALELRHWWWQGRAPDRWALLHACCRAPQAVSGCRGRVLFALGQGVGPYMTGDFYSAAPAAAFVSLVLIQLLEAFVIVALRHDVPFFVDRDPPSQDASAGEPTSPAVSPELGISSLRSGSALAYDPTLALSLKRPLFAPSHVPLPLLVCYWVTLIRPASAVAHMLVLIGRAGCGQGWPRLHPPTLRLKTWRSLSLRLLTTSTSRDR